MKTKITQLEGDVQDLPAADGFNVLLVTDDGSFSSTQIWHDEEDNRPRVARTILDALQKGLNEERKYDRPVLHAFVKPHGIAECYHFDLTNVVHVAALARMNYRG